MTALRRRVHRRAEAALARARGHAVAGRHAPAFLDAAAAVTWAAVLIALGGPPKDTA